jgi:hypothetical protein
LNPTTGINGSGTPSMTAAANPGSPSVVGASPQAVPAASVLPGQTPVLVASDGSGGEHASTFVTGLTQRVAGSGFADSVRLSRAMGRSNLPNTLPQPILSSSPSPALQADSADEEQIPSPRGADLIAEALPFVGDSLERSLDEFVRQLRAVDVAGLGAGGPMPIVIATVAVLGAATSAVVMREIVRRLSARGRGLRVVDSLGREFALSFPELPRSWSERR